MSQAFAQFSSMLQQALSFIIHLVQMAWTWSVGQVLVLSHLPWQSWPLWKQIFLGVIIAAVAYGAVKVVLELWEAGERILAAFVALFGVFVRTLPTVLIAGAVALGGIWVLNNVTLDDVRLPWMTSSNATTATR